MNWQRIQHGLTGYHLRDRLSDKPSSIAICSCGWRCRTFRRIHWRQRLRSVLCLPSGHNWGGWEEIHAGPIDFEESAETLVGHIRQCDRCYKCEIDK